MSVSKSLVGILDFTLNNITNDEFHIYIDSNDKYNHEESYVANLSSIMMEYNQNNLDTFNLHSDNVCSRIRALIFSGKIERVFAMYGLILELDMEKQFLDLVSADKDITELSHLFLGLDVDLYEVLLNNNYPREETSQELSNVVNEFILNVLNLLYEKSLVSIKFDFMDDNYFELINNYGYEYFQSALTLINSSCKVYNEKHIYNNFFSLFINDIDDSMFDFVYNYKFLKFKKYLLVLNGLSKLADCFPVIYQEYLLKFYKVTLFFIKRYRLDQTNQINDVYGDDIVLFLVMQLFEYGYVNESYDLLRKAKDVFAFSSELLVGVLRIIFQEDIELSPTQLDTVSELIERYTFRRGYSDKFSRSDLESILENNNNSFVSLFDIFKEVDSELFNDYQEHITDFYDDSKFLFTNIDFTILSKSSIIRTFDFLKHIQIVYLRMLTYSNLEEFLETCQQEEDYIPVQMYMILQLALNYINGFELDEFIIQQRRGMIEEKLKINVDSLTHYDSEKLNDLFFVLEMNNIIEKKMFEIEALEKIARNEKNWENASKELINAINKLSFETFNRKSRELYSIPSFNLSRISNDLYDYLVSAEFYWRNLGEEDKIYDYTPYITLYIKVIEMYLKEKVYDLRNFDVGEGQLTIQTQGNTFDLEDIHEWGKTATIGNLIHVIRVLDKNYLKDRSLRVLISSLYDFLKNIRNAKFHTSIIPDYSTASVIRIRCLELMKMLNVSL